MEPTDIPLSQANSIFLTFSSIAHFQRFKKAERIKEPVVWQENLKNRTLILPRYLYANAIRSGYVDSCEMVMTEPPAHALDFSDIDDHSDIEILKCPTDQELEEFDKNLNASLNIN